MAYLRMENFSIRIIKWRKNMKKRILCCVLALISMLSLVSFPILADEAHMEIPGMTWEKSMELEFATEFTVDYYEGGYALINVIKDNPYLVVPEGMAVPEGLDGEIKVLQQPLDRVYLQATAGMAMVDRLDAMDHIRLVGTDKNGWYVENAVKAMEEEKILFAGKYSEPDYELLINEGCDLALESTMLLPPPKVMEMIELLGIPVFLERASYEAHPLGRTEWIKVYGVLFGKGEKAESFFKTQASVLDQFVDVTNTEKTVAFFYLTTDGSVNIRSSSDYVPTMIEIAGGRYVFEDVSAPNSNRSSVSLTMEEFYNTARNADYLIYNSTIDAPIYSVDELLAKDRLFADFKAVQNGDVWCTGKYLFQATDIIGDLIVDFNHMLTGQEDMTFLYKLT